MIRLARSLVVPVCGLAGAYVGALICVLIGESVEGAHHRFGLVDTVVFVAAVAAGLVAGIRAGRELLA
jgi:hypothetical protein